jgi:DNA-binding transcriptional ArsR family regulator
LELLNGKEEGMKVTEIRDALRYFYRREYDIKTIMFHLEALLDSRLISSEKKQKERGRPVIIKLNKERFPIFLEMGGKKYEIL